MPDAIAQPRQMGNRTRALPATAPATKAPAGWLALADERGGIRTPNQRLKRPLLCR